MLEAVCAVLAGLMIGSFLNVCIYRLPLDLSVWRPSRSFCPVCERTIAWYDNIPVLSFVLLSGRCRTCRSLIPLRYPLVEVLTATAFLVAVRQHGFSPVTAKTMLFSTLLIGLIFTDIEERILPHEFTVGGALAGIVLAWFLPVPASLFALLAEPLVPAAVLSPVSAALDGVVIAGVLWLLGAAYLLIRKREGLGFGDVLMIGMIAVYLGLSGALLTLILGSLAGTILGLAYIRATGKDPSTYQLPFGSFLGAAALLIALAGDPFQTIISGN